MKNEIDWKFIGCVVFIVIVTIILIVFITLEIYTLIEYGNVPHDELPSWVLWLWFS